MTKTITPEQLILNNYYIDIDRGLCVYRGVKLYKDVTYYTFEYASNKKMFLEERKLDLIRNYDNSGKVVKKLNKLGDTSSWIKTKAKELAKVNEQSGALIQLFIERLKLKGYQYDKDTENQVKFESDFPFQITIDQDKAVQEIKSNLESELILQAIVVGDVGMGKSEVYSRAAFKVVDNGKQVAVLLPSSILANQAYIDLIERFSSFPEMKIVLFAKNNTAKLTREIIEQTASGEASIIVGTTAILSDRVVFKDLGLLVCDEAHKFGFADKTKLQNYKKNLNTLYLSATPNPADLNRALSGVYDLSKLATPPSNKKAIITEVALDSDKIIKMYIDRELSREGQIYVIHNNTSKLEATKERLEKLVPCLKIGIVNGKMDASENKQIMADFKSGELNLLLATTIIEVGLSINNANTMIILESENLGLASLHQNRGRCGRSGIQAYCLLTHEVGKVLEPKAIERLKIMKENSYLGAGDEIAKKDAEMRGNGEILGNRQSGHISDLGSDYFNELLEKSIKGKKQIIDNEKLDKAI
jgi:transcription-repair coupling factor (superfamily II helicase)